MTISTFQLWSGLIFFVGLAAFLAGYDAHRRQRGEGWRPTPYEETEAGE